MRETFSHPKWERSNSGETVLSKETLNKRQELMDEMRALHVRTHSYKNHGHLPRVAMPQLLEEV